MGTRGEQVRGTSTVVSRGVYTPGILSRMTNGTYSMWNLNSTEIIANARFARLIVAHDIDEASDGSNRRQICPASRSHSPEREPCHTQ